MAKSIAEATKAVSYRSATADQQRLSAVSNGPAATSGKGGASAATNSPGSGQRGQVAGGGGGGGEERGAKGEGRGAGEERGAKGEGRGAAREARARVGEEARRREGEDAPVGKATAGAGSSSASGASGGGGGGGAGVVRLERNAAVQVVEDAGRPGTLLVAFAQDGKVGFAPEVMVGERPFVAPKRTGLLRQISLPRMDPTRVYVLEGSTRAGSGVGGARAGSGEVSSFESATADSKQFRVSRSGEGGTRAGGGVGGTRAGRLEGAKWADALVDAGRVDATGVHGTRAEGSQSGARAGGVLVGTRADGRVDATRVDAARVDGTRAEDVMEGITKLLACCVTASSEDYFLLAAFVLNTWVNDYLDFAPYIVLQGPPQAGKSTVLRLMSLICRHGLLAADITIRGLLNACTGYQATVLLDDFDEMDSPTLRRLLRAGTLRNMFTLRGPLVGTAYGPKIIATTEPISDPALSSRCVRIAMHESRNARLIDPFEPHIMGAAEGLRTRLVRFRLAHAPQAMARPVEGEERLRARARELLRSLAAPFSGREPGEKLQYYLEHYFTWEERQLTAIQTMALPMLFEMVHRNDHDGSVTIVELGRTLRTQARELGHGLTCSPRKLGWELRGLGLVPRRGHEGTAIDLYGENVRALHEMTQRYKSELPPAVPFPGNPEFEAFRRCAECREYRIVHEGLLGGQGAPSSE